ncbi:hypothetical protein K470DRAFT_77103 [Piedraia hortae CBS 480.64]|uniref:BZIP domain-containing protein n=1 Tax=Piedraia hortae CBS 480.64 TaxID=1314780 RepID=A0A6A7BZ01_9PEZI|nr:hypothetical protein K470DRAFT_77103 [Piedraia hortae CBS 480.64]
MPLDVQHPPCVTQSIYANSSGQQDRFDLSQFFAFDDYSPRPDDKASWIAGAESVVDDTWNALQAVPEEDQLQFKGPSHDYCAYRQQVGVPMGGLSHVLQVNNSFTSNALDTGWACPKQDWVDKNDASFIATNRSVSTLENCPVGRLWPGMHSQQAQLAALGKAAQKPLQAQTEAPDDDASSPLPPTALVKNEEPVDEDERLLKSEEGKKLTSLQRRQLRNKVSARAFRYRRKG